MLCNKCHSYHSLTEQCNPSVSSVESACSGADARQADKAFVLPEWSKELENAMLEATKPGAEAAVSPRSGDGLLGPVEVKSMLRAVLGDHPAARVAAYELMLDYMKASREQQVAFCAELRRDYDEAIAKNNTDEG